MAEYYGYAERDANAYVDWGKLGQNLTETVQAAYKIREERKKKLDDIMEANYNELVNAPSGLNQDINKSITSHVGHTKEFLLRANKLLKAGVLRPEDYTLIMQNQKEDNKAIFDNAKNWQTAWAKTLDAVASGKGSKAMLDLMSDVESFGKFNNMDFMINPVTGRVNASKMIINGNGERIKGESMTMQQLNVLMNQNIDKYKLTDKLVALQGQMGENIISKFREARIQKNGQIGEITDKRIRADYDITKKTFIDEITANPINTLSILMDYKNTIPSDNEINAMLNAKPPLITAAEANEMRSMAGKAYRTSTNPNDFGKADVIYYEDKEGDGSRVARLTTAQEKVVNKFASDQFDGLIDHKESNQAIGEISQATAVSIGQQDKKQRSDTFGELIGALVSGTPKEKMKASAALNNMKDGEGNAIGNRVEVSPDGRVTFIDANGRINPFNITGGDKEASGMQMYTMFAAPFELDKEQFRRKLMNTGSKDVVIPKTTVRTQAGQKKAATDNTGIGGNSSGKTVGGILGIQ